MKFQETKFEGCYLIDLDKNEDQRGSLNRIFFIKGEVWDVASDLRKGSITFLNYYAANLTKNNPQCFFIPEGFAHSFQTLVSNCEMLYFHNEDYNKDAKSVINSNYPQILIKWPKFITETSVSDNYSSMLDKKFSGFEI